MSNLAPDPDDYPASGGGWISGPMTAPAPEPQVKDGRPEYCPTSLVLDVCAVLRRAGIPIDPGPNVMYTATIAAADLLDRLGVRPVSAPDRSRP